MKKSLAILLLLFAVAAIAQQPAAPTIKDPAEYNAYVNAVQQQDPNAKAQALEAFLQTYPNSVMKDRRGGSSDGRLPAGGQRAEDDRRGQQGAAGRSQQCSRAGATCL